MSYTPTFPVTAEQVAAIRKVAAQKGFNVDRWLRVSAVRAVTGEAFAYSVDVCERTRVADAVPGANEILREIAIPARGKVERYRGNSLDFSETPTRLVATNNVYLNSAADGQVSAMQSLATVLRANDELLVKFVVNNSNTYLREAGLAKDEAYLSVVRNGKIVATFVIETRVYRIDGDSMVDSTFRPAEYALVKL